MITKLLPPAGVFFMPENPELKYFLDTQFERLYRPDFIPDDPISVPHSFRQKEDIEISGFLTAILSWGQRKMIIQKANNLMIRMDRAPFDFVMHASLHDLKQIQGFVYRTFNETDCLTIIEALRNIYSHHGGLESVFTKGFENQDAFHAIQNVHDLIFSYPHLKRSQKHIANPASGSAAKRLNMYLRWLVRPANCGIDFGLWKSIHPAQLICPLDVHSGTTARKLGILRRKQNDRRAAEELTAALRMFDQEDPVKYDFVLFGLGTEGFNR
ncbi:MAG: TIGR02757 family protein [Bacteroidales bacterium]